MNRLFGRREEPRRSSDDDYNKMQYFTSRGEIPAKVVDQQVREVVIDTNDKRKYKYPHEYENEEEGPDGTTYQNFEPFEQRNRPEDVRLYETPINSRMNLDRKSKGFSNEAPHHRDRARIERNEINTPGPFRGVAAVEKQTGRNYGVAGVTYLPRVTPKPFSGRPWSLSAVKVVSF
ncbi:hypothetical protein NXS19_000286 [Fusarium pseudograminearum]|nr:hypothetical protein NXS19_000286 [Fusarium pseudograminearum]